MQRDLRCRRRGEIKGSGTGDVITGISKQCVWAVVIAVMVMVGGVLDRRRCPRCERRYVRCVCLVPPLARWVARYVQPRGQQMDLQSIRMYRFCLFCI